MPIKLLQHKSWHVYSQENIARVKRDEALAAAKEDEQHQRTMIADSEARIDRMKQLNQHKKRKRRDGDDDAEKELDRQLRRKQRDDEHRQDGSSNPRTHANEDRRERGTKDHDAIMSGGHVNFWAHLEGTTGAADATLGKRIDKAAQQKESELDALTKVYLAKKGEGEPKGWYASEDGKTERERKEGEEATLERAYRDNETKRLVDPLALMNSYLKRRDDIRSGNLDSATRRKPSTRDRYLEPTASTSSRSLYSETPRSDHNDLEPVVEKLLGERRRRGDPVPPPPPIAKRDSKASPVAKDPQSEAQQRVSAEKARTAALLAARRKAALGSSASSVASTPRSEYGAHEGGFGMFNREDVRVAKRGGGGWAERRDRRGERERESRESWRSHR
ncbi:uncharacterized protein JCM15063_004432 [Sporobolomyces koalae]|uniref:uncharacterized protein n=1 Tax=Sporobolomyces koalae TaxID=500713 RepID=UPI00317CC98F